MATSEDVLITDPPPAASRYGMPYLQHRKMLVRLTSITRFQVARPVSSTDPSSGSAIPALLNSTSMRPNRSATAA